MRFILIGFVASIALMSMGNAFGLDNRPAIGSHVFEYSPPVDRPAPHLVSVAGDFNDWTARVDLMRPNDVGVFEATINLPKGLHHYKFVVDGKWINDPRSNPVYEVSDGVGGTNSAVVVGFEEGVYPHRFVYVPDSGKPPHQVFVAGDFDRWSKDGIVMAPDGKGLFATTVNLPAGIHMYKFVVDGQWIADLLADKNLDRFARPVEGNSVVLSGGEDVAAEALAIALDHPEPSLIANAMRLRVLALLAATNPVNALEAAKSYYNVCPIGSTQDAVDLVALCFLNSNPGDLTIIRRFRDEQVGASLSSGYSAHAAERRAILHSVPIDASGFEDAIRKWSARSGNFNDRVGYGDLLLAADRGQDAERVFRELYLSATTPKQLATAVEGIARCLRAEDGTVARANAWLTALRKIAQESGKQ